jgi:hypothetical protein
MVVVFQPHPRHASPDIHVEGGGRDFLQHRPSTELGGIEVFVEV